MTKGIFMLITGCKPAVGIIHMVCEGIITGACTSSFVNNWLNLRASHCKKLSCKKTVNYWQLWLPASYCNNTVCYCFWN